MRLRYERLLRWQQNRLIATLWQLYEFQLFVGSKKCLADWRFVCCMLLPRNPYRLTQHYKRHVCGPSCCCKHRYLWVSPIFEHYFCLNYMGTVRNWQHFWSKKSFYFIGQCWYINPQQTPEQAIIVASCVRSVYQLRKMSSYEASTYISVFVEGFRRWRECILALEWKADVHSHNS
jgi:hypothetical protein